MEKTEALEKKSAISVTHHPKWESSIPQRITRSLLDKEQFPSELPKLGSSIIEDFILEKLSEGRTTSVERIVEAFFKESLPAKIDDFANAIKARSEKLSWDEIFTKNDVKKVKEKVVEEMAGFGMAQEQIAVVASTGVEVREKLGTSLITDETVYVSRLQAVRKAVDYIQVFGQEIPFEQIVKVLMYCTTAHELGHKVDIATNYSITNRIPGEWKKDGELVDLKGERFAQYWGIIGISGNEMLKRVRQKEWLIHIAKVRKLWDTIFQYNSSHEKKIDLSAIFRGIEKRLKETDKDTRDLLWARQSLYGGNEPENFALPYSKETIVKAMHKTETSK